MTFEPAPTAICDDCCDFSYSDRLETRPVGQGSLVLGAQFSSAPKNEPRFLFVHGGYHGAWCFAHFLKACDSKNIPVAAINIRGHGGLEAGVEFHKTSLRDMADDVVAGCSEISGPILLVGHSLGSLIASLAAMQYDCAGLGLLAPSPPSGIKGALALAALSLDGPALPPAAALARERFLGGVAPASESRLMKRLCAESPRALNERYGLQVEIDRAKLPQHAICISAGQDSPQRHPPGQDADVADFYGAEYHHLDNLPHCMMYAPEWEVSLRLLLDWRARLHH